MATSYLSCMRQGISVKNTKTYFKNTNCFENNTKTYNFVETHTKKIVTYCPTDTENNTEHILTFLKIGLQNILVPLRRAVGKKLLFN